MTEPEDPLPVLEDVINEVSQTGIVQQKHAIQMSMLLGYLGAARDPKKLAKGLKALEAWQRYKSEPPTTRTVIAALIRGYRAALEALDKPPEEPTELDQDVLDVVLQSMASIGSADYEQYRKYFSDLSIDVSEEQFNTAREKLQESGLIVRKDDNVKITNAGEQRINHMWG